MNKNNVGKVKILSDWIKDEPEKIAKVFAMLRFVPVRAELCFYDQCIHYVGISERFDEVPEHFTCPEYELEIQRGDDGWPSCVIVKNLSVVETTV
jgi:hypothetical protein